VIKKVDNGISANGPVYKDEAEGGGLTGDKKGFIKESGGPSTSRLPPSGQRNVGRGNSDATVLSSVKL